MEISIIIFVLLLSLGIISESHPYFCKYQKITSYTTGYLFLYGWNWLFPALNYLLVNKTAMNICKSLHERFHFSAVELLSHV